MTDNTPFKEPEAGIFVAYTPPERVPDPDGKTISAGSQTLVNYIKGIKVQKINIGGWKANQNNKEELDLSQVRTVRIEFDPESIGLSHPIAANIAPTDEGLNTLMEAAENDQPVNVAIESIRKSKNSKTSEPISPLTPIYHLLGADKPGTGSDMGIAGRNTYKVISAVNGVTTVDCRSDATQWASLQKNRDGARSPEGYILEQNKEDWTEYGYIVPDAEYTPRPTAGVAPTGGAFDMSGLFTALEKFLDEKLTVEGGRYVKRPIPGYINEGKPFEIWTSDKKINLGSYLASKRRYVHEWAYSYLSKVMQSVPDEKDLRSLTDVVLDIADKAQVKAYGGNVRVDRTVTSHTEASRWTQWTIENLFSWKHDDNEWENKVVDYVSNRMKECGDYALKSAQESKPDYGAPNKSQSSNNSQPKSAENAQQPDKMELLKRCLSAVNDKWNDSEALRKIYAHAKKTNLLAAPVAQTDQGLVFQKGSDTKLGEVIVAQGKSLVEKKNEADQSVDSERVPEDVPADTEPEQDTVQEKPVAEETSDDAPMSEDAFASMLAGNSEEVDWSAKLAEVSSVEEAKSLWNEASSSMNEKVTFNGETMALSEAFQKLNEKFSDSSSNEDAQDLAEQAVTAESIADLQSLRKEANNKNLLEVLVNDGQSDQELTLDTVIKNRRVELRVSK